MARSPGEWPNGLQKAAQFYDRFYNHRVMGFDGLSRITTQLEHIQELVGSGVLEERPTWHQLFHTIIQIGCFGCLESMSDLKRALHLVFKYLRDDGIFISVTWIPKADYIESELWGGNKLSRLPAHSFVSVVRQAGLIVDETRIASLADPEYCQRYVIIARKP